MNKFFFILTLFYSLPVLGTENIPDWINNKPKNNSVYRYYVGVGTETDENCVNQAIDDVKQQIIDDLGTQIIANYDSYLSESNVSMQQNINQKSSVILKGLKREKFFITSNKNSICYVLYSYPQKEFKKEDFEQKQEKNSTSVELNEIEGKNSDLHNTVIFKTNNNLPAVGYIDGQKYTFPAKYNNEFKPGKHTVKIVDDYLEAIDIDFIAYKNEETPVTIILKKAKASLTVQTTIEGINLEINGKKYDTNEVYSFTAGDELKITATHSSFNFVPQILILKKNEHKVIKLRPEEKKAKLILKLNKKISFISIDDIDHKFKKDFDITPNEHTISVKIDGIKKSAKINPSPAGIVELSEDDFTSPTDKENKLTSLSIIPFIPKSVGYYKNNINAKFIENDYDFSFLKAKLYSKPDGNTLKFITKISFDSDKYKKNYIKPILGSLKKISYTNSSPKLQKLNLNCKKDDKLSTILCKLKNSPENTTAYVRAGDFQENFFSYTGEFYVVENLQNFLHSKNYVQQQKLEVFVTIFDEETDEEIFSFTHPFVLNHFEKRDLSYNFNPTLFNLKNKNYVFSEDLSENYGATSISFTNAISFFDFSKKIKIFVGIGVVP